MRVNIPAKPLTRAEYILGLYRKISTHASALIYALIYMNMKSVVSEIKCLYCTLPIKYI